MTFFELTPEQQELRQLAAKVAREVYAPKAAEWDARPHHAARGRGASGWPTSASSASPSPRSTAAGGTLLDAMIVIEELAKECRPAAFQVFEATPARSRVLEYFGTQAQKRGVHPALAAGEITMGVCDLRAGSRLGGHRHEDQGLRRDGDEYVDQRQQAVDHRRRARRATTWLYCRLNDEPGAKGIGGDHRPQGDPRASASVPARS